MRNFDLLSADVALDLAERGFSKVENYTPTNCGSMINLKTQECHNVLVRAQGSIANFSEYVIYGVHMDENYDETPILVASVYYHSFSECGAWYGDGEEVKQMYIPVDRLAEFFRNRGVLTKKEHLEKMEGLRAKLRKARLEKAQLS